MRKDSNSETVNREVKNEPQEVDLQDKNVVFFDGVCNLCNASVDFIARRNSRRALYIASLQSNVAKENLPTFITADITPRSIVFWQKGNLYQDSSAILQICKYLDYPWPLLRVFILLPQFIRNFMYRTVARYRYRWFGKSSSCRIPTEEEKAYFLE